jgi:hypothetical protein
MQANRNERLSPETARQRHSTQTIITTIAVLILGVVAWLMFRDDSAPPETDSAEQTAAQTPAPTPQAPPEPPPAPDIPDRVAPLPAETVSEASEADAPEEPAPAAEEPEAPAEDPLTLANSDERLRDLLGDVAPAGLPTTLLENSNLIERGSAAIDAMRRGLVPDRLLNLPRPEGTFAVRKQGDQVFVDPQGYRRYDQMVSQLVATPIEPLVEAFSRFRPLLEEAYGALGYAPDRMDNALIGALDEILRTPDVEGPLALERHEAVWIYQREDLESLSLLQKQLLRTGPENVTRIKEKAAVLRRALLEP